MGDFAKQWLREKRLPALVAHFLKCVQKFFLQQLFRVAAGIIETKTLIEYAAHIGDNNTEGADGLRF